MSAGRRMVWVGLAVTVVASFVFALAVGDSDESVAAHTRRLAAEFRCVDCEGLSVADSATASAREQRRDIAARIRRGDSDAEIRQYYVDLFGESTLLRPSGSGIGIVVWGLPIMAVLFGAIGLGIALRRWRRRERLTASAGDVEAVERHRAARPDPEASSE